MNLTLTADDYVLLGSVLLVMLVGRATRSETRMLSAALIVAVVSGSPSAIAAVAVLGLVAKGLDVLHL